MSSPIELFERAAAGGAQLLRVEQCGSILALTFDVGLITIEPGAAGSLLVAHPEGREEMPEPLRSLDEEEPWWRLLGNRLTAVSSTDPGESANQLRLRFREAADQPRTVSVTSSGRAVLARLETTGRPAPP